jgi:hypothetical protein
MAIVQNLYTGNGSTVLFPFSFPYLEEDHVFVTLNGTLTTAFTFPNANTVEFNTAPAAGAAIRIFRETPIDEPEATIFAGSAIRASDLNRNNNQLLYVSQETQAFAQNTDASAIQATADLALVNSSTAISTANSAVVIAQSATATANGIAATANTALSTANSAVSTANAASSTANAISSTANTALSTANSASSTANSALATANAALPAYVVTTTAVNKTLVNRERCTVTAAGLTITLPASPSVGSEVAITVAGTITDTIIARNGQNIMSLAEDFTVDRADVTVTLYYVDATRGWRIV